VLVVRLAWRNAFRNPRRTGIVLVAVAVGIAGTLLSVAFNYGLLVGMVETAIGTELGHVQIHGEGFDANPELSVRLHDGGRAAERALAELPAVSAWSRRVRSEGLVSSPRASAGVRLVGIEPDREARVSRIAASMVAGSYLDGARRRVVIGEELARRLEVGIGDKIVISVQDLGGDLSGEAMRVGGLFRTASRALDRSTVFVRLEEGQSMLGLGQAVNEMVVIVQDDDEIDAVSRALGESLERVEVRTWEQIQPVLVYLVEMFDQMAILIYAAIFVAMAFGIANVLLMTIFERTREIGIMRSIGLSRSRLVAAIVLESVVVTLVGVGLGFVGALAGAAWFAEGIDLSAFAEGLNAFGVDARIRPVLRISDFTGPTGVALLTALAASAWPAWRAVRLVPADAVRHS
jgi:ABC-type lipoprotein release transport system permease subunit